VIEVFSGARTRTILAISLLSDENPSSILQDVPAKGDFVNRN
jgi:hypothetical protein